MRATTLGDLLADGDRVAVSNITGREASAVTVVSQNYCGNIVAGWALGKGGTSLQVPGGKPIAVYSTVEEMYADLPPDRRPNKIIVYSPPAAVYGEVKGIVQFGNRTVETIFVITEHVSVEVTAKIHRLCSDDNIDVLGCNTLGMINAHDGVRVGAVGGDTPSTSFLPGGVAIISNSGNMVNTMASYLLSAGMGTAYGVSTGKDPLILTPLKDLLALAINDPRVRLIVLYIEPGGLYEAEAVAMLRKADVTKPIIVYITGEILADRDLSLGHAGAVVEGGHTSAAAKMKLFDDYFGIGPFDPDSKYRKTPELVDAFQRGIRITTLHHLPVAAKRLCDKSGLQRDFRPARPLKMNPWFVDYKTLGKALPSTLILHGGTIPEPYAAQMKVFARETLGFKPVTRSMRDASHASSNDGSETRLHGFSLEGQMAKGSFAESLLLAWTGEKAEPFEVQLLAKCLIASLSNGPGTISAQAAKLSTSAGNAPNTAMIATLACIGDVHGGNGRRAVDYLTNLFGRTGLTDPYDPKDWPDLDRIVAKEVNRFKKERAVAKEIGGDYRRIPCLGHPVFHNEPVNYDPRERVIAEFMKTQGLYNIFLKFYHALAHRLKAAGIARNVWAVNLDGAIAAVTLGICWRALIAKRMTLARARDLAFAVFAVGRAAGSVGEYLDHQDFGSPMDMRIPVSECTMLTRSRD